MLLIKINPKKIDKKAIEKAADLIKKGGVVAFPTETVYGLGTDTTNETAVKEIFKVKGRPPDNPLIVHIADLRQLELIAKDIPDIARQLINKFWPGPLTLVLKKRRAIPDIVTAGLNTFAVRMPSNTIALELIKEAGVPVAAPSANKSGRPSPTLARHVAEDIGDSIDMIIDGGQTEIGIESTVIDLTVKKPRLLRLGAISKKQIENIIGQALAPIPKTGAKSPGMKYTHYSPAAKIFLFKENDVKKIQEKVVHLKTAQKKCSILTFDEHASLYSGSGIPVIKVSNLKQPARYAKKIFALFRQLDNEGIEVILIEGPPKNEEWSAIADRLAKAASVIVSNK